MENPVGLNGMSFIEYSSPHPEALVALFEKMGFQKIAKHKTKDIDLYRQNGISFFINRDPKSFAIDFSKQHGPCACTTGFRVQDSSKALEIAVERGAKPYEGSQESMSGTPYPAMFGIGDSLIYFLDAAAEKDLFEEQFEYLSDDKNPNGFGLSVIDHLTNNVPKGEMTYWKSFYEKIFNFQEIRYFDIRGEQTGLLSHAMRSPCGKITIPINEPKEEKSQIQEYLDEYKGSGIQHIALSTNNICETVSAIRGNQIGFLDVPGTYYEAVPDRVPNVTEDMQTLEDLQILVDGDEKGYLLQIFTQNQIGPIFFEIIQRKGHDGFGEGNFQALFESIERDQKRRGVL